MTIIILFVLLILLLLMSLAIFNDIFSPASIVCESFILAYICACYSSHSEHWLFDISIETLLIIFIGLLSFIVGSFFAKSSKVRKTEIESIELEYIDMSKTKLLVVIFVQMCILIVFLYYYKAMMGQLSGMLWSDMLRMYRFIAAYGEGMDTPIPGWVSHLTKIARANAYVALYVLMHNIAIQGIMKTKKLSKKWPLCLIIGLYIPYSILQAARFELLVLITMGIIIWYTYYSEYSEAVHKKQRNIRRSFYKIVVLLILVMIGFSSIGTLVGRLEAVGILSEATNYFGRTIQALDNCVIAPFVTTSFSEKESLYALIKFFSQLGLVSENQGKFYLSFTSLNGYSLGNTYTALRRYFVDYNIFGVVLFPTIMGYVFTKLYRICRRPKAGSIDYSFLCYSSVIYCAFLYSYEEFFWSTVISVNYVLIFACLYVVSGYVNGNWKFNSKRIRIKIK